VLKRHRIGTRAYGMPGHSAKDRPLSNIVFTRRKSDDADIPVSTVANSDTRSCTNHCNLICAWDQANWILENLIMARKPP
jgi:hypothetical protein